MLSQIDKEAIYFVHRRCGDLLNSHVKCLIDAGHIKSIHDEMVCKATVMSFISLLFKNNLIIFKEEEK